MAPHTNMSVRKFIERSWNILERRDDETADTIEWMVTDACSDKVTFRCATREELSTAILPHNSGIIVPFSSLILEDYGVSLPQRQVTERVIYPPDNTLRGVANAILSHMRRPLQRSEIEYLGSPATERFDVNVRERGRCSLSMLATHSCYVDACPLVNEATKDVPVTLYKLQWGT